MEVVVGIFLARAFFQRARQFSSPQIDRVHNQASNDKLIGMMSSRKTNKSSVIQKCVLVLEIVVLVIMLLSVAEPQSGRVFESQSLHCIATILLACTVLITQNSRWALLHAIALTGNTAAASNATTLLVPILHKLRPYLCDYTATFCRPDDGLGLGVALWAAPSAVTLWFTFVVCAFTTFLTLEQSESEKK